LEALVARAVLPVVVVEGEVVAVVVAAQFR
jgi:hypothetical protein